MEGVGQTLFERLGLVISCSAYLAAIGLLIGNRREFSSRVFHFLAATLIALFVEDFASAAAADINGFAKTVAHLCQVVALYFVYKAFVEVGLRKPYDLLLRSQRQTAEALERERQFLEAVLDNAQSGIVACDANGVLTLFNRACASFMAWLSSTFPRNNGRSTMTSIIPMGRRGCERKRFLSFAHCRANTFMTWK